jgi:hypothetical protein
MPSRANAAGTNNARSGRRIGTGSNHPPPGGSSRSDWLISNDGIVPPLNRIGGHETAARPVVGNQRLGERRLIDFPKLPTLSY